MTTHTSAAPTSSNSPPLPLPPLFGSHNSGTFAFDFSCNPHPRGSQWWWLNIAARYIGYVRRKIIFISQCQTKTITQQIDEAGAQMLDLRVCRGKNTTAAPTSSPFDPSLFWISHTFCCIPLTEAIAQIKAAQPTPSPLYVRLVQDPDIYNMSAADETAMQAWVIAQCPDAQFHCFDTSAFDYWSNTGSVATLQTDIKDYLTTIQPDCPPYGVACVVTPQYTTLSTLGALLSFSIAANAVEIAQELGRTVIAAIVENIPVAPEYVSYDFV